jgi:hypothetical protein
MVVRVDKCNWMNKEIDTITIKQININYLLQKKVFLKLKLACEISLGGNEEGVTRATLTVKRVGVEEEESWAHGAKGKDPPG